MSRITYFLLETFGRIGSSIFAGTLVSCLILDRIEWLHIILMSSGLILMVCSFPLASGALQARRSDALHKTNTFPRPQDEKC